MLRIETTPRFERMLTRFIKRHPDLRPKTVRLMQQLAANPYDTSAKAHALGGPLKGCCAASISFDYRIVFYAQDGAIWFISIGSHDEVY